jgi:hypothetical protein
VDAHKKKDGHEQLQLFGLTNISDKDIEKVVLQGKNEAQQAMEELEIKKYILEC